MLSKISCSSRVKEKKPRISMIFLFLTAFVLLSIVQQCTQSHTKPAFITKIIKNNILSNYSSTILYSKDSFT